MTTAYPHELLTQIVVCLNRTLEWKRARLAAAPHIERHQLAVLMLEDILLDAAVETEGAPARLYWLLDEISGGLWELDCAISHVAADLGYTHASTLSDFVYEVAIKLEELESIYSLPDAQEPARRKRAVSNAAARVMNMTASEESLVETGRHENVIPFRSLNRNAPPAMAFGQEPA